MAIFDKARMFLGFQGHNWSKSIQEGTQRGGQPQLILPGTGQYFLGNISAVLFILSGSSETNSKFGWLVGLRGGQKNKNVKTENVPFHVDIWTAVLNR